MLIANASLFSTFSDLRITRRGLAGLFALAFSAGASAGAIIRLQPGDDVAGVVARAPENSTFVLSRGVYRMQHIVPKNSDSFTGEDGAVLDGAVVVRMRPSGPLWAASIPRSTWRSAYCDPLYPLCLNLNDLFIDDVLQTPVVSRDQLAPGAWYYDDAEQAVFISNNPEGHIVEFSTTTYAFSGRATGVRITNLTIEKYASPPQRGAIGGETKPLGWTVSSCKVIWNHGTGIELGSNADVRSCLIAHNGQKGIGMSGDNDILADNEIAANNYAHYKTAWEAGGTKFARTNGLIVQRNYVHDNIGHALWTDIDNVNTLYENNKVVDNQGAGIHHEISYKAIIRNNVLEGNHDGILIANSPDVEVYGNYIVVPQNGGGGIRVVNQSRGSGAYGAHVAQNDRAHENTIIYLGRVGHSGIYGDVTAAKGVVFDYNRYYLAGGGAAHWSLNGLMALDAVRQLGLEEHATVLGQLPAEPDVLHK